MQSVGGAGRGDDSDGYGNGGAWDGAGSDVSFGAGVGEAVREKG